MLCDLSYLPCPVAHTVVLIPGDGIGPEVTEAVVRIRDAYNACLTAGEKTHDLGGSLSTTAFTDAIIAKLGRAS